MSEHLFGFRPSDFFRISVFGLRIWAWTFVIHLTLSDRAQVFAQSSAFTFETVRATARKLSSAEFRPDKSPELPDAFKKLTYDDYHSLHFVPGKGPWQDEHLRFTFQLFHRGFIYQDPVRVHLVEQGQVRDYQFSPDQFNYGKLQVPVPANDLKFAGLRVLYPINYSNRQDEVAAFLGASYFRLLGAHERYGASVRGLAIDTAEPSGEEFPQFTDFWIEKPGPLDNSVKLYALLDSPSVAGAYRFVIQPGDITQVEVESSVFFRKAAKKIGVAPITSMFLVGENRTKFVPDFRPEIHDSDGLLLHSDTNQWIWRPLQNPEKDHVVTPFPASPLKGFGLLQRDRVFDHYQDLGAREELRPSMWVEPHQDWGTGRVELVEIPTPAEYHDNIVAYWVPSQNPNKGEELHWSYRISACTADPQAGKLLRVAATRITPQQDKKPPRFVIDFCAKDDPSLSADAKIETNVHASHGTVRNLVTEKNEVTGGWRTFFDLAETGSRPADLSLFLHRGGEILSETWTYQYRQP